MSTSNNRNRSSAESTTGKAPDIQTDRGTTEQRRLDVAVVRAEWNARLPRWMQPFLTWLIGYPYTGQEPLIPNKPWWLVVSMSAVTLILGLALSFLIVSGGGYAWLGIPFTWLMVVFGARTFQVSFAR